MRAAAVRAAAAAYGSHRKRAKVSAAAIMAGSSSEEEEDEEVEVAKEELEAYLALPQVKCKTEKEALDWWKEHADQFPNVAVMARQYLGCPATSAAVERLFSQVGIMFSKKRQSSKADTLAHGMFANINLP